MKNLPHRFIILIGGFVGFNLTYLASLAAENNPTQALIDSSFGCIVGAILVRFGVAIFMSTMNRKEEATPSETVSKTKKAGTEPSHSY